MLTFCRYIEVICHDDNDIITEGSEGCKKDGVGAHTLTKQGDHRKYDTVILCNSWFDYLDSTSEKLVKMQESKVYPRNNVMSLQTQGCHTLAAWLDLVLTLLSGSALLHELLHTAYDEKANPGGFLSPGGKDVDIRRRGRGKAYGAARAKWLAQNYESYGMQFAAMNVDNYVYFAIARFMTDFFNEHVTEPQKAWRVGTGSAAYADDDAEGEEMEGMEVGDWGSITEYGSKKPCDSDDACGEVCRPGMRSYCHKEERICRCLFGFSPIGVGS